MKLLDEITEAKQCTVAVVTVNSLEGKSATAFADDFYDYNGYGYGPGDDGIMLVVSPGDRTWAITDFGKSTDMMRDNYDWLQEQFVSLLASGNYYEAFTCFVNGCDTLLSE